MECSQVRIINLLLARDTYILTIEFYLHLIAGYFYIFKYHCFFSSIRCALDLNPLIADFNPCSTYFLFILDHQDGAVIKEFKLCRLASLLPLAND